MLRLDEPFDRSARVLVSRYECGGAGPRTLSYFLGGCGGLEVDSSVLMLENAATW